MEQNLHDERKEEFFYAYFLFLSHTEANGQACKIFIMEEDDSEGADVAA
jgi:hypothetical protein